MELSTEQKEGLKAIDIWRHDPDRWMFYLGGYAGTGKTTLIQHYINSLGAAPLCLAPTGKAATVLQRKLTNAIVRTVHSALYRPRNQSLARLEDLLARLLEQPNDEEIKEQIRVEKQRLAAEEPKFDANPDVEIAPGDLVIIDEASMVSTRMMDDLGKLDAKVLFVGDPGQLPPVRDSGYFTYGKPDHMLSQVQRQALDNPIIRLSMDIREGNSIPYHIDNEHIKKFHKSEFDIQSFTSYDQVMTGKNDIRRKVNRMIRKIKGIESPWPVEGEKLIFLKNQYKFGLWLTNGIQAISASDAEFSTDQMEWVMDVLYEDTLLKELPFYSYHVEAHYNERAEQEPYMDRRMLAELDYSYCITVHKSQGSEWNKIVLIDDRLMEHDTNFRKRWLYTAVTRAKESLVWLTS